MVQTTSLSTLRTHSMTPFLHPAANTTRPLLIGACDSASYHVGRNSFVQTVTCTLLTVFISFPEGK